MVDLLRTDVWQTFVRFRVRNFITVAFTSIIRMYAGEFVVHSNGLNLREANRHNKWPADSGGEVLHICHPRRALVITILLE